MHKSRRQILRVIAGAPLVLTFGFVGEALMRFAKPTMKPFGVFDPADQPVALKATFLLADFPTPWTCLPFMFHMGVAEFNPEQQEIRTTPAFAIRLQGHEIVAYSRICPAHNCGYLNYVAQPRNCGCNADAKHCCGCAVEVDNPVLRCPCDGSVFDLADGGRVLRGPAKRPPRRIELDRQGDIIAVVKMEVGGII